LIDVMEREQAPRVSLTKDRAGEPAPPRRAARIPAVVYLLVGGLLIAGVVLLVLAVTGRATGADAVNGDEPVAAARVQALNLMTLDYRTAKRDLQRLVDGSTGKMHDQYAAAIPAQVKDATSARSVSTGTILSAGLSYPKGLSSLTGPGGGDKAEVLVAGDATVNFPKSGKTPASKVVVHYRFRFEMTKVNGVWKSAQLNFAGLPSVTRVAS
jgi:Mce-associated membrane protein